MELEDKIMTVAIIPRNDKNFYYTGSAPWLVLDQMTIKS